MTLAQELSGYTQVVTAKGRHIQLEEPPFRLAFNGELSRDEQRMLDQGTFSDYAEWEA